ETPRRVADGLGLYLLIQPNGSKLWRWNYRLAGKQKTISYGVFPDVGVDEARRLHATARERLRQGFDPALRRRQDRHGPGAHRHSRRAGRDAAAGPQRV